MRTADLETIHGLIDWFSLHQAGSELETVSLAGLDPWFRITIVSDAHPKYSWCAHPFGGMMTEQSPGYVFLRADLTREEQRLCYAHEIGHLALGHQGSAPLYEIAPIYYDRAEREAWQAAAILLVPMEALVSGLPVADIAASLHVPEWLVQAHPLGDIMFSFTSAHAKPIR